MTIYKPLECIVTEKGYCVTATMKQEKYSNVWDYEIHVAKNSIGLFCIKCARTTWRKKYAETVREYS